MKMFTEMALLLLGPCENALYAKLTHQSQEIFSPFFSWKSHVRQSRWNKAQKGFLKTPLNALILLRYGLLSKLYQNTVYESLHVNYT